MHAQSKSETFPKSGEVKPSYQRIQSIDILRGLTMVLMIWVNDFWSLRDVPEWLEHVPSGADGIGFSDVIFPAFLFIVGLSLPYAVQNRRRKGDTTWQLVQHVLFRTIALLVMGVFFVNGETFNADATGFPRWVWGPLCCLCFILIWNAYPTSVSRVLSNALRGLGIVTLIALAIVYRGGEEAEGFSPKWWGILGLIGWAYLVSGLVTVFARDRFSVVAAAWLFFCLLSMASKAGLVPSVGIPEAIAGGTLTGLTLGGVVTSLVFRKYVQSGEKHRLTIIFLAAAIVLTLLSIATRPYWGLAKLGATPAWLFLCSAFTLLAFLFTYWIADVWKKTGWFEIIRPAGTDTLLCYLMPFFIYMIFRFTGLNRLPEEMITGEIGLIKSLIVALLCVQAARGLNAIGVKLKI